MARWICFVAFLFATASIDAQSRMGYYRYPTVHADTIVFAAEGDLWRVGLGGGLAHRLTTHPGEETHPAISPDGTLLAFTATYEGPAEIYVMPVAGGLPRRLTFDGDESTTLGWTRDGEILITTNHYSTLPSLQLVTIDPATGRRTRIPLSEASEASFDASGDRLFFVRPAFHRNVTKRYRGGTARQIWRFDDDSDEAVPLTGEFTGESHTPMWWSGRVYFITDRDDTMNIWSMDESGQDLRQHSRHRGWDVRDASLSDGRIVYQVGADLWMYETRDGTTTQLEIELASDFDQLREAWISDPLENLTSASIHPEGDSVVLTARGRVFVAPVGSGRLVRASRQEGVRFRDAVFMPDGKRLLALHDASGEFEFATLPSNGVGGPLALTDDGAALRFGGRPSPDGARVAYTDNNNDLWMLEIDTGSQTLISTNREGVGDLAWSPDGRYLAYAQTALNTFTQIFLFDVQTQARIPVTSERVNSMSPVFSTDGRYLYFLSDRDLVSVVGSPWGPRQPEPYFDAPIKVYEVSLQRGLRSRFRPRDELYVEPTETSDDRESDDDESPVETIVDADGIGTRIREVPAGSGNYRALSANDDALFWLERAAGRADEWRLRALPIDNDDPEAVTVVDDVDSYDLSLDGGKLLIRRDSTLFVFDAEAAAASELDDSRVDLGALQFPIDVREDWRQIFIDAWRMERDYFYDPGMHGVDWNGVRDKYLPLVDRVTTRDELSELIGRAVGELSALHTSVRGGDMRDGPDDIDVASLGARLSRVRDGFRIDYVYQTDPDYPRERSPLADPALEARPGDIIVAVNGVPAGSATDIGALLRNQVNRQVLLTLSTRGAERDVVVVPIGDAANLRYSDWEYTRRAIVDTDGNGEIGYVHLRAMGSNDITAWYRQFYPVFNRAGLIIDMRHNRGGNIDSLILEKLIRQAWFYWQGRVGEPYWNMHYAFRGHMVVLVDANTASDGEAFAEGFKRLGLGPVIGVRTWGGEIWLNGSNTLSDGGIARAPMIGVYGPEGEWLIENRGVEPDIVVDNLPHATFNGEDAQLATAIEYLLEAIERDPRPVPPPPAYPDVTLDRASMSAN